MVFTILNVLDLVMDVILVGGGTKGGIRKSRKAWA